MAGWRAARIIIAGVAALLVGAGASAASSGAAPADRAAAATTLKARSGDLVLKRVATATQPVYAATAPGPGARRLMFVVERTGAIRVLRRGKMLPRPFVDLSSKVRSAGNEEGLLSVAFDPRYQVNRRFFVYYTGHGGNVRVASLRRRPGSAVRASPGSFRPVIKIPHPESQFHNGAQVSFGPDGNMWLAPGDGGAPCDPNENAQSTRSLLGKILRIKPKPRSGYTVPADNPYVGKPGRDEIYSLGLRNPYRFSFDRRTKTIAIGDVGQAELEEVDYLKVKAARAANFGWDALEGSRPFVLRPACSADTPTPIPPDPVPPIHEYPHVDGSGPARCAITGGPVVRDRRLPSLRGRYVYADLCDGRLRSLIPGLGGAKDDRPMGLTVPAPTSIVAVRGQRIYVTSIAGGIYRLRRQAPAARAAAPGDGQGGFRAKQIGPNFNQPVYATGPRGAGGLLFVVEQPGRIVALRKGKRVGAFLDIRGKVSSGGERGLLSVAFSPRYRRDGRFYVYFTDRHGDIVVQEYRRAGKNQRRARPGSARTVIKIRHRANANHNGGQLQFGPDGKLYLGTGDGGAGGDPPENAQNVNRLLGKLIRINPRRKGKRSYRVPRNNPFVGKPGRDEIYSLGLRNPFRFSFDRKTGDLLIGDVGQSAWEEVNFETLSSARGANFGWDAYEGRQPFDSPDASPLPAQHSPPIFQYSHAGGNCSITGGYVSRDRRIPSLRGRYLYADYCKGEVRSLIPRRPDARDDKATGLPVNGHVSSFGEDAKGRLYYTTLGGKLYSIRPR